MDAHKQLTTHLEGDAPSAPKLQAQRAIPSAIDRGAPPCPAPAFTKTCEYAGLTPQQLPAPSSLLPPPRLRASAGNPSAPGRAAAPAPRSPLPAPRFAAFTLVESVIAIGLFAFVIVGIVGLFGSALDRQRQASFETRAVMVSQQLLARIRAADSATNVAFTIRATNESAPPRFFTTNIAAANFEFAAIYQHADTAAAGVLPPNSYALDTTNCLAMFEFSTNHPPAGRARITATTNGTGNPNLYRITIEVSEPANLPLQFRRYTNTFTTLATFPN